MDHIKNLKALPGVKVATDTATKYEENKTWRGVHPGTDYLAVVTVKDSKNLPELIKYCATHNIKIITRSGGTALTGGSSIDGKTRGGNCIILKLYAKQNIKNPEIIEGGALVKIYPGNTTKELNQMLIPFNRVVPVDLGIGDKEGAAQILGYLATNARGSGAAFKGTAIDMIQSLRVLTADGIIHDLPSNSSTSPAITDIAGMGGTTGIILEAVIKTARLPKQKAVAVLRIKNIDEMYELLEVFKKNCWQHLNLFERMNNILFEEVIKFLHRENDESAKKLRSLGNGDLLFIELTADNTKLAKEYLQKCLIQANLESSALITTDPQDAEHLLSYRIVNASLACNNFAKCSGGQVIAFDISVPTGDTGEFPSEELLQKISCEIPNTKTFSFGHAAGVVKISADSPLGGTAIHFNPVVPNNTTPQQINWLRDQVFSEVATRRGEIVSEHTPGTKLAEYVKKFKPNDYKLYLKRITHLNPKGILNPNCYVLLTDLFPPLSSPWIQ